MQVPVVYVLGEQGVEVYGLLFKAEFPILGKLLLCNYVSGLNLLVFQMGYKLCKVMQMLEYYFAVHVVKKWGRNPLRYRRFFHFGA